MQAGGGGERHLWHSPRHQSALDWPWQRKGGKRGRPSPARRGRRHSFTGDHTVRLHHEGALRCSGLHAGDPATPTRSTQTRVPASRGRASPPTSRNWEAGKERTRTLGCRRSLLQGPLHCLPPPPKRFRAAGRESSKSCKYFIPFLAFCRRKQPNSAFCQLARQMCKCGLRTSHQRASPSNGRVTGFTISRCKVICRGRSLGARETLRPPAGERERERGGLWSKPQTSQGTCHMEAADSDFGSHAK